MRRSFVVVAGIGVAAPIAGAEWEIDLSKRRLALGERTTVTLSIAPPPGDYAVAAVGWNIHATEDGWSDQRMLLTDPGQTPGTILGSSILGISAGQLATLGYDPTPGRIEVWSAKFTKLETGGRTVDLMTETSRFLVYPTKAGLPASEPRDLPAEGRASIEFIPAPGAIAVLSLSGLAAARRRRPQVGGLQRGAQSRRRSVGGARLHAGGADAGGGLRPERRRSHGQVRGSGCHALRAFSSAGAPTSIRPSPTARRWSPARATPCWCSSPTCTRPSASPLLHAGRVSGSHGRRHRAPRPERVGQQAPRRVTSRGAEFTRRLPRQARAAAGPPRRRPRRLRRPRRRPLPAGRGGP